MPRQRKPYWVAKDRAYYTKVGGRPRMLRHPDGTKVADGDAAGVRAAVARLLEAHDAAVVRAADPTVEDVCSAYLVASSAENDDDTTRGKEWILGKFCAAPAPGGGTLGTRPAREVGPHDLARLRRAWEKKGLASGFIRRLYREVMACWAWAARPEPERVPVKLLPEDPLKGLKQPAPSRGKPRYVPAGVVEALVAFAHARAEATPGPVNARFARQAALILRLIAETGCRPKEACESRWADFDAGAGLIVLGKHKTARKTGRDRIIVVPPGVVRELEDLRASGHAHPVYLFAHKRGRGGKGRDATREAGQPWDRPGLSAWFARLRRRAIAAGVEGVPPKMTLYWMRVSYISDAISAGLSADTVADAVGNSAAIARGSYHEAQAGYLRETAAKVAEARKGKTPEGS